jgi:hypothetical protein
MKSLLFLALVFGMMVLGSAQTAPDVLTAWARTITPYGNGLRLTEAVEVSVGMVSVTADEADFVPQPIRLREIELRGNVRMSVGDVSTVRFEKRP